MRSHYLFLILLIPVAFSWVYPHQSSYSVDPYERVRLCATAYTESNAHISLTCGNETVGEQNVVGSTPVILCYEYVPKSSTTCVWSDGKDEASVKIDVFPNKIINALLAALLVVLIIRFAARLVKISL